MSLIQITWGDRDEDGHGKWRNFFIEANKTVSELEAIMKAADKHFDFSSIAYDCDDNTIGKDTVTKLTEAGFDFHLDEEDYEDRNFELWEDDISVRHKDGIEELLVFMWKYIDPTLELSFVWIDTINTPIGYGVFFS